MASSDNDVKPPANLDCGDEVTDTMFHPTKPIITVAHINGNVTLYSYDGSVEPSTSELRVINNHKKSVRCVRFNEDGAHLFTAGKDKSWTHIDLESGRTVHKQAKAHESAIFSMEVVSEYVMLTGDEDGYIKMWDTRRAGESVMSLNENGDVITDMVCHYDQKNLLVTSGDGTLSCVNLKKKALDVQSEMFDSEFLSLAIVKDGSKVVVGDGEGVLNLFNWSEWGNISDRYPGHPSSIDCMLPISENVICTGCMDGKLRVVNILPNSIEKVFGDHGGFPVQRITINHDTTLLATCSHDSIVRFYPTPDTDIQVDCHKKRRAKRVEDYQKKEARKSFFSDL